MQNILLDKWNNNEIVTGDKKAPKPDMIAFKNTVEAVELLRKHIKNNSNIVVHCDVDMDGIGSGYIVKKFLKSQGANNSIFIINKEKVHGIQEKHIEYLNNKCNVDLLIVVDSSTNDIEYIKQMDCDVLVVDHHLMCHDELLIKGEHDYIIVNNMIENNDVETINEWIKIKNKNTAVKFNEYKVESRMSGALVLYELLRVYCEAYNTGNVLENLMLFQWVGITLFSDIVLLANDRNQWYIENTVATQNIEPGLDIMIKSLTSYKSKLDKSFIVFTLAPLVNRAIRAGFSGKALDIVLNNPMKIAELMKFKEIQEEIIKKVPDNIVYNTNYILKDITDMGITKNYCGTIASKLCGSNNKSTVVFIVTDGIAEGSFRGKCGEFDYVKQFKDYSTDIFAQGHGAAFGFKVKKEMLADVMKTATDNEPKDANKFYITAGEIKPEYKGQNHIEDMQQFKKDGLFWRLGVGNSKVSTLEQIEIIVPLEALEFKCQKGKLIIYDVLGIECKAFEPINTQVVGIYVEYNNCIEAYARNHKM